MVRLDGEFTTNWHRSDLGSAMRKGGMARSDGGVRGEGSDAIEATRKDAGGGDWKYRLKAGVVRYRHPHRSRECQGDGVGTSGNE